MLHTSSRHPEAHTTTPKLVLSRDACIVLQDEPGAVRYRGMCSQDSPDTAAARKDLQSILRTNRARRRASEAPMSIPTLEDIRSHIKQGNQGYPNPFGGSSDDSLYFDCHLCGLARAWEDLADPNRHQCKICTWCDQIIIGDDLYQEYKWCHCGGHRMARFFFILDDPEYTYCRYCRVQEALSVPDLANLVIRPSLSPVHSHASYGWVASTLTQAVTPSCPSSTPSQDLDNPFVISPSGSSQPYLCPLDSSSLNRQPYRPTSKSSSSRATLNQAYNAQISIESGPDLYQEQPSVPAWPERLDDGEEPCNALDGFNKMAVTERDRLLARQFNKALLALRMEYCTRCRRRITDPRGYAICQKCRKKDAGIVPEEPFYFSAQNELDLGDVPADLPKLSMTEQMIIAADHVTTQVRMVRGAQYRYKGHCVSFMRKVAKIYEQLPLLPDDLEVIIVKPKNYADNPLDFGRHF